MEEDSDFPIVIIVIINTWVKKFLVFLLLFLRSVKPQSSVFEEKNTGVLCFENEDIVLGNHVVIRWGEEIGVAGD